MSEPWPESPAGDMAPILAASVAEAKARHPSSACERLNDHWCDRCGARAAYRVRKAGDSPLRKLEFCGHHFRKHFPAMEPQGWIITGVNPDLVNV